MLIKLPEVQPVASAGVNDRDSQWTRGLQSWPTCWLFTALRNLQIFQMAKKFPTREQPKYLSVETWLSQLVHPYNRARSHVMNDVAAGSTDVELVLADSRWKQQDAGWCVLPLCWEEGRRKVQPDFDIFICVKKGWKVGWGDGFVVKEPVTIIRTSVQIPRPCVKNHSWWWTPVSPVLMRWAAEMVDPWDALVGSYSSLSGEVPAQQQPRLKEKNPQGMTLDTCTCTTSHHKHAHMHTCTHAERTGDRSRDC